MDSGSEPAPNISSPEPMRFCGICHKPFLKETSYHRHVLYCRRAQNRPNTRARSCRACTKAKAKCSFQPRCQRCTNKGLDCVFDTPASTAAAVSTREAMQVLHQQPQAQPLAENVASIYGTDTPEDLCAFSGTVTETEAETATQANIDWDCFNFTETGIFTSPAELPWITQCPMDDSLTALTGSTYVADQPVTDYLVRVPMVDPVSKVTANIVMQMLCAFPQGMLRRETFPPFLHPHWSCTSGATESTLPEPLVNCMGLAQVFASHNPDTRPFLWHSVKAEQRSLATKARLRQLSKQDHLAAVQAMLIYIMMRVVDNSKMEHDLNLELLVTYQGLCNSFKELCNEPFYQHERLYPSASWQDWVFAESRRRTAIVWLLITQMVHIKIGVPCDTFTSFRDIPLSSPKSLWDARTRSAWESEYEVYKTMPRMGLDDFGDLYDACKGGEVAMNKTKLHTWNATVDNLGILLSLGAEIM